MAKKIDQAIAFSQELLETEAGYFNDHPSLRSHLEKMKSQDSHYLAHEYFNQDLHPLYFSDVVKELSLAKLTYVGSTDFFCQSDHLYLNTSAQATIGQIPEPIFQQKVWKQSD